MWLWLTVRAPQVMCCDYGFRSGNMRLYQDNYGSVPRSVFVLVSLPYKFVTLLCKLIAWIPLQT